VHLPLAAGSDIHAQAKMKTGRNIHSQRSGPMESAAAATKRVVANRRTVYCAARHLRGVDRNRVVRRLYTVRLRGLCCIWGGCVTIANPCGQLCTPNVVPR
jgi:hypothetical protein